MWLMQNTPQVTGVNAWHSNPLWKLRGHKMRAFGGCGACRIPGVLAGISARWLCDIVRREVFRVVPELPKNQRANERCRNDRQSDPKKDWVKPRHPTALVDAFLPNRHIELDSVITVVNAELRSEFPTRTLR